MVLCTKRSEGMKGEEREREGGREVLGWFGSVGGVFGWSLLFCCIAF